MAKRNKKGQKSHAKLEGYVVVAFAEDMEQATEYKSLLEANDISATITAVSYTHLTLPTILLV